MMALGLEGHYLCAVLILYVAHCSRGLTKMCSICARPGLIVSGWLLTYPQILQLLGPGCLHAASVRVSRTPGWSWEAEGKVYVC